MYKKSKIIFLFCVVLTQGCTLEDATVFESGDACNAEYIAINNGECVKDECPEYDSYLTKGFCPQDYPKCYINEGDVFYCSDKCPNNTHEYRTEDGTETRVFCEPDSVEHCGEHGTNCLDPGENPGWYIAECGENKRCRALDCKDGYSLRDGDCLNSSQCCGSDCKDCTRINHACSKGECVEKCQNNSEIRCNESCLNPMTSKTYCGSNRDCQLNECNPDQECRGGVCS